MAGSMRITRTALIKRALSCVHIHLGAPSGFGKTILLEQLYHHFMRGGRGPRKGCFLDASGGFRLEDLPQDRNCRRVVAVDNIGPDGFAPLAGLLALIHGKNARLRLFTAGAPLPLRPYIFYKSAGTTLELGMDDLAFSVEELRILSPTRAEQIRELSAGWPFPAAYLASLPPSLYGPALKDENSILRTWMRDRVLVPCEKQIFEVLTRLATFQELDRKTVARFADPDGILPCLEEMRRRGWPLRAEEKGLKMHPFMRRCLQNDLEARGNAEECRDETIRYYRQQGSLLLAARTAFEGGRTRELSGILSRLESRFQRIFDPELRREFGKWIDCVTEREEEHTPRFLALAARCKNMAGMPVEALQLARRAVAEARRDRDDEAVVRSSLLIARILRCQVSLEESNRVLDELRQRYPGTLWPLRYGIAAERAYNLILESDYRKALDLMGELKKAAAEAGDPRALWAERFMAIPLSFLGRCEEALACFRAGEKLPALDRFLLDRHGVYIVAARCMQLQGMHGEARRLLEKQLALKRLSDDSDNFWLTLLLASEVEFFEQEPDLENGVGDLTRVEAYLERARALLPHRLENPFFHARYRIYSSISEALTHPERIRENMSAALKEARARSPFLLSMLLARGGLYRLLFLKKPEELPEIVDMLRECLAVSERIGAETYRAIAFSVLAVIYDSLWLKETALSHLRAAFARFEKENLLGLFRTPANTTTLVDMAWERGVAPEFLKHVVERYGYRPKKWRARLFGRFEITPLTGEEGSGCNPLPINRSKIRELLAYLIHRGGKPTSRQTIVTDLWPDTPWARATRLYSVTLSQLRAALRGIGMEKAILGHRETCGLDVSELVTDREDLENLQGTLLMLPLIEREGQNLREEFERLRLAPLREGYLSEFDTPWARAAAKKADAQVARAEAEASLPHSA